jgi:hypothetical protein
MSNHSLARHLVIAGAALLAPVAISPGTAEARTVAATIGASNTPEVNGVKHEDCVSRAQNGSVMNVCKVAIDFFVPLPIDTAGKKSLRITAELPTSGAVSPPPPAPIRCTAWATDERSGTLVLATGSTPGSFGVHSFTIGSHPVPEGGRLHLYCVLPPRAKLHTINYTS